MNTPKHCSCGERLKTYSREYRKMLMMIGLDKQKGRSHLCFSCATKAISRANLNTLPSRVAVKAARLLKRDGEFLVSPVSFEQRVRFFEACIDIQFKQLEWLNSKLSAIKKAKEEQAETLRSEGNEIKAASRSLAAMIQVTPSEIPAEIAVIKAKQLRLTRAAKKATKQERQVNEQVSA